MMTITVEAIYENGMLRPAQRLPLRERETVEIEIRSPQSVSERNPVPSADAKQQALQRLLAMNLPVANWDQMEQEIIRGAIE